MKLSYIIFIITLIYFTTAEIQEQTQEESNNENGKAVTSSYTYSIEYTDNNSDGKYGHKIEVKDGSAKVNVHAQHPKSVEQTVSAQHEGFHRVPQKTSESGVPQHQQPAQISYIPATNIAEGHAQYQQKIKLPENNDPKLPIHSYDQQQLALLLTQNKNPFLPMIPPYTKENNQIPHHQQVLGSAKQSAVSSLTQSQPQKVTYYVPQSKPQATAPTYSKPGVSYTVDPKYASQENGIQFEQSPKMVQYQYEYSHPQQPQLYYQPVQYMQLGLAQSKLSYPNYSNYYNIPVSSALSGSSPNAQNIQHYQPVPTTANEDPSRTPAPQYYANIPQLSNQHVPQYVPQTVLQPSNQYKTSAGSSFGFPQYAQIPQHSQPSGGGQQVGPVQFLPPTQGQSQGHTLSHLFVKPQGVLPTPSNHQNHYVYQPAAQTTSKSAQQVASYPANLFASGQYEYVYPGQKQNTEGTATSGGKSPSFRSLGSSPGQFGGYLPNPVGKPQIASASQEATKYINLPVQSVQPAPHTQGNSYHFVNLQGYKPTAPLNYNQIDFQPNKNTAHTPQHFNSQQSNAKTISPLSPKQYIQPHQTVGHKLVLNPTPLQGHNYYSQPIADNGYKTPGMSAAPENPNQQIKYVYIPSYNINQSETVKGK